MSTNGEFHFIPITSLFPRTSLPRNRRTISTQRAPQLHNARMGWVVNSGKGKNIMQCTANYVNIECMCQVYYYLSVHEPRMFGSQSTGCVCRRQLVEPVLEFIFDNLLLSTQDGTSRVRTTGHVIPFHSIYLYPLANGGRCVVAMLDNQPEESSSWSS